jgi:hypothetical protein
MAAADQWLSLAPLHLLTCAGVNNAFLVNAKDPLATTYNDSSGARPSARPPACLPAPLPARPFACQPQCHWPEASC